MRTFYSAVLGSAPNDQSSTDKYASYVCGGATFALHAIPQQIARDVQASPTPRESGSVKFILSTPHVAAERIRLESLGATILQRPWQDPDQAFDAADLEGNVFSIIRN